MTKQLIALSALLLALGTAPAQTIVWTGIIGTPQAVPDPVTNIQGPLSFSLSGANCPLGAGLHFEMTGLPINYLSGAVTNEECWLVLAPGFSSLPGTPILGGLFYLPLANTLFRFGPSPASYLGPGDIVCTGGNGIAPTVQSPNRYGASWAFGAVPPGLGSITAQAYLYNPTAGRIFTTNAINLTGL